MLSAVKDLAFQSPLSIHCERHEKINMVKALFKDNKYFIENKIMKICEMEVDNQFQLILQDNKNYSLVIIENSEFDHVLRSMKCKVNEVVYFIKDGGSEVFETYIVNEYKVVQKVGEVDQNHQIKWLLNQNILERRKDFQGLHFKAFAEQDGVWTKINDKHD